MITRQDIENEAEFIQKLIKATNPTGGKHTPTPWQKLVAEGCEFKAIEFYRGLLESVGDESKWAERAITTADGKVLAFFLRPEDRDLALYFANAHPPIISMLRSLAAAFEYIAVACPAGTTTKEFARKHEEQARIYADIFCRLGKPPEDDAIKNPAEAGSESQTKES